MSDQWPTPSEQEVEQTLVSIADLPLRALFFSELKNPEWLEPLQSLGVFNSPPEPHPGADGEPQVLPWPEGDYLLRIAAERPADVTNILKDVERSANPWVHRAIVSIAAALPSRYAKQLAKSVARIVSASTDWINAEEVMATTLALSSSGETASARSLLMALFSPLAGPEEEMGIGTRTRVRGAIDDYLYMELLPKALPVLVGMPNIDGLKLVTGWLQRASEIQNGAPADQIDYDVSIIWRPSIAAHAQNSDLHDIPDALIDVLLNAAVAIGLDGRSRQVISFLNGSKLFVIRRIALEAAAQLATDDAFVTAPEIEALLLDASLMGIGARPEYAHLGRVLLPHLSAETRSEWIELVAGGTWQGSDDDIRRIAAWGDRDVEDVTVDDITDARARLLHRFLQPLAGSLPPPLDERLRVLEEERGSIPHAEFGSYTESFTGPTSPKTRDELAAMTPDALAGFLESWQPAGEFHFGPSIEGLARELEWVAESRPELVGAIAGRLAVLGRSYVRAALTGWARAVPRGYVVSEEVWGLVAGVVGQADDGTEELVRRDFDAGDPVWRWAQRAAADLIAASVEAMARPVDQDAAGRLWALLKPLTGHADPTVEHESRYGGSNMDPLTLSLNTTRPAALRAAIRLASTSHETEEPGNPTELELDILDTVGRHVDEAQDPSLAVAAVIGEGLGRIWGVDPNWVDAHGERLFALVDADNLRRARSDVIVSVALRVYRTGASLLKLIGPAFPQLLSPEYRSFEHIEGWREHRSVVNMAAQHLVSAYLLELITRDNVDLQRLFSPDVADEVVADALGHIGWSIMRTTMDGRRDSIPAEYLERASQLIDWRVEEVRAGRASARELSQFHWWVSAGVYSPSWWLPILLLATNETDLDSRGSLGKPLADAAVSEPVLAVAALKQLLDSVRDGWRNYDLVRNAPRLLAIALRSGDDAAVLGAQQLRDLLGRQGHFQALQELELLLRD